MIPEPQFKLEQPAETAVDRITLGSHLRWMWRMFRTAFTNPNSTTVVDITTGRVVENSDPTISQPSEGPL